MEMCEVINIFQTNYTKGKIDFRVEGVTDTLIFPTDEMREILRKPEIGEDAYHEDPTINKLEDLAAKKVGKEASLFIPSGTMGNLITVLTLCHREDEVILEATAHMLGEGGGISAFGGVMCRTIFGDKGILYPHDIKIALINEHRRIRNFYPKTKLICLENPHNRAGGIVIPLEIVKDICQIAHDNNVFVHLDGARIFHAAVALNTDAADVAKSVDSVMFCLSKE